MPRVAIIDSDATTREALALIVADCGFEAVTAASLDRLTGRLGSAAEIAGAIIDVPTVAVSRLPEAQGRLDAIAGNTLPVLAIGVPPRRRGGGEASPLTVLSKPSSPEAIVAWLEALRLR